RDNKTWIVRETDTTLEVLDLHSILTPINLKTIEAIFNPLDSWLPPLDPVEHEKEEEEERKRENQLTKSIQELHATRVSGIGGVKYMSTSEKKLKRKLIQKNVHNEDGNNLNYHKQITRDNNKSEDEDDSKTFATSKRSKLDSFCDEKTLILKK
ncbi:10102_t:CDS:2, partial [Gigaspora rosea]